MTLDDVYGADNDRFPLEQEARIWAPEDLGLDWDESELERVAQDLGVPRKLALWPARRIPAWKATPGAPSTSNGRAKPNVKEP